ncbi:MAG: M1 family aminopeptidase [Fidelibacterota bacterium]
MNRRVAPVLILVVTGMWGTVRAQDVHRWIREMERGRFLNMENTFREELQASKDTTFDVTYYQISLRIDPLAEQIEGNVTTRGVSSRYGLKHIVLDFFDTMTVDSVLSGDTHLTYTRSDNRMSINLPGSFGPGESFEVTVFYRGKPVQEGGFHSFDFGHHGDAPIISTLSEPFGAPTWWPCKDDPADKADSVDIVVRVPASLVVASNGLLQDVIDHGDGTRTYVWAERYPIATYLVSLAISNYEQFSHVYVTPTGDSMEVMYFVYPEHLRNAEKDFSVTVPMIEFYSSIFGEYPFVKEKYGMAEFPWGGAMEHQTCTSYGARLIRGDHTFDWIIAHELAHQWFGDLITMRWWSHIWLNEGFATYSEALWREHEGGLPSYLDYMDDLDSGPFGGSVFVRDSTQIYSLFSRTVYDKGAWVLHMLRHVMGDTMFFEALKEYVSSHTFGNTTTGDFRTICESYYEKPLHWFFDEWVYGQSRPEYQVSWSSSPQEGHHLVSVEIRQAQASLFKMPLDVVLATASLETTVVVWDSLNKQTFEFVLDEEATGVEIDPDGWVLKEVISEVEVDADGKLPESFALLPNYPNPFNTRTTIPFRLGSEGEVSVGIFNLEGQRIRHLQRGIRPAGQYELTWNGRNDEGMSVSSGIYFVHLQARKEGTLLFDEAQKVILMR